MKKINNIFKIGVVAFLLFSCEDVLVEDPPSLLSKESFYQTEDDAIAGLFGAYANIYGMYDGTSSTMGDVIADDLGISTIVPDFFNWDELTYNSDVLSGFWSNAYRGIFRANTVIDNTEGINFDAGRKADLISEAKALRAIYYWNLVRAIGDVPLYEKSQLTVEETFGGRIPSADIYAVVIRDLTEAASELPATSEPGRINSNVANALLARIYLYRGDYANALTHATNVINSGNYDLFANYADVFNSDNKNGVEHIFQLQRISGENQSSTPAQFGPRELSANRNTFWSANVVLGSFAPSATFVAENPTSYRKSITVSDRYQHIDGITGTILMADIYGTDLPYYINKFDAYRGQQVGTDYNFSIVRYADVLLMAAEASNEVDPSDGNKYTWINMVRKRARTDANGVESATDLPDLSGLTQEAFRTAVLEERRFELCFEGVRAWDLKRKGEFLTKVRAQGKTVEDFKLLFPVPDNQIILNSNLTQNPGW